MKIEYTLNNLLIHSETLHGYKLLIIGVDGKVLWNIRRADDGVILRTSKQYTRSQACIKAGRKALAEFAAKNVSS